MSSLRPTIDAEIKWCVEMLPSDRLSKAETEIFVTSKQVDEVISTEAFPFLTLDLKKKQTLALLYLD